MGRKARIHDIIIGRFHDAHSLVLARTDQRGVWSIFYQQILYMSHLINILLQAGTFWVSLYYTLAYFVFLLADMMNRGRNKGGYSIHGRIACFSWGLLYFLSHL